MNKIIMFVLFGILSTMNLKAVDWCKDRYNGIIVVDEQEYCLNSSNNVIAITGSALCWREHAIKGLAILHRWAKINHNRNFKLFLRLAVYNEKQHNYIDECIEFMNSLGYDNKKFIADVVIVYENKNLFDPTNEK